MANIVAIVGRPNVGKSTFFNRLVEQRKAIMDNVSGVTRDRHYGYAEWLGKHFTVIDTGGYVVGSEDIFEESIRRQVELAIQESDVLLFMVDCEMGVTDLDKDFANVLRRPRSRCTWWPTRPTTPNASRWPRNSTNSAWATPTPFRRKPARAPATCSTR
jgi:GTP-binding protein